jgi:predicted Zn-dependent protease
MSRRFAAPCRRVLRSVTGLALAGALTLGSTAAQAATLIRDAEIEATLKRAAAPLFRASGVGGRSVDVLVIGDSSLNAFVVNSRAIFLHSGLIMRLDDVQMLQAVMAHELAHITSGHLVRRSLNAQSANTAIGVGMLLGLALSAAGQNQAATGVAAGTAMSATRNFLAHTRGEEAVADQTGARYLISAGIDAAAAVRVLKIFEGQEALSATRQDPYARSHPLSADRIRNLEGVVAAYGSRAKAEDETLNYWYDRTRAKFRGFIGNPSYVLRKVKASDTSEAATLTRAVAYHRLPNPTEALRQVDILLAKRPNDPYYTELKGQFLLEAGHATRAAAWYAKAVALAPKEPLILAGHGRALLAINTRDSNREALRILSRARDMDPRDERMLRDLALAWARAGNDGMASLVTAERYALLSRFKDAETHALRAEGLLARGSAGWLQAQDIIGAAKVALRK